MRKINIIAIFILIVTCLCLGCDKHIDTKNTITNKGDKSDTNNNNNKVNPSLKLTNNNLSNLKSMQKNGFEIIKEQSFWVQLENWGKVHFVSGYNKIQGIPKVKFYLVNSNDDIVYDFPDFYGNMWVFYELKAVSFKDINKDGLKDIIIIADYILGHGENAAVPFPVSSVYFQKDKKFINLPELDEQINYKNKNQNIDSLLKFFEGKDIKLDK